MDFEMPQAFQEQARTARKQHVCCECRQLIMPGNKYQYASGVWEGKPDSFKTCLPCANIRDEYMREVGEGVAFKELASCIGDCFSDGFGPCEYAETHGIELHHLMALFPNYYADDSEPE